MYNLEHAVENNEDKLTEAVEKIMKQRLIFNQQQELNILRDEYFTLITATTNDSTRETENIENVRILNTLRKKFYIYD